MPGKVKILVVEDEAITALLLKTELDQIGYQVCAVLATGEEAVNAAKKNHFDVVLMDIRLAGQMNGIEAAKEITAHYEVPIIFMTGYADNHIEAQAQELHPAAYLNKPVDLDEIKQIIDGLFDEKV